jgi:hypothetical protein
VGIPLRFRSVIAFGLLLAALVSAGGSAHALEAVTIRKGTAAIDLLPATERYQTDGDRVQLATAPGSDGIVRRIEVIASVIKGTSDWAVFALANNTDEQVDRLIVAPHYTMAGSGIFWPDLGSKRIVSVTPSQGFRPEKQA